MASTMHCSTAQRSTAQHSTATPAQYSTTSAAWHSTAHDGRAWAGWHHNTLQVKIFDGTSALQSKNFCYMRLSNWLEQGATAWHATCMQTAKQTATGTCSGQEHYQQQAQRVVSGLTCSTSFCLAADSSVFSRLLSPSSDAESSASAAGACARRVTVRQMGVLEAEGRWRRGGGGVVGLWLSMH